MYFVYLLVRLVLAKCKLNLFIIFGGILFFSGHISKVPFPKINQDRAAKNVFDLQNDFRKDLFNFSVYGEKINLGHFRPFFMGGLNLGIF